MSAVIRLDTWFGEPDEPILGFVSMPDDARVRAGVVICAPLGHEQYLAYRGLRLLGDELAARGFATVRFDYAGEGDSGGVAPRAEAPELWLDSIERAARLLRDAGVPRIALVGLTSGGLLAALAAPRIPDLDAVVLWDPDVRGRRFVRRQRSLLEFALGSDAAVGDEVPLMALDLHADAAAWLDGVAIDGPALAAATPRTLLLGREGSAATDRLAASLPPGAARRIPGQADLLEVPGSISRLPVEAVAEIVEYLDGELPAETAPVTMHARSDAALEVEGVTVVERLHRVGPDELFAMETIPALDPPRGTVILQPGSAEHRVGPARFQTLLARDLAADGFRAVRFDRLGTGESTPVEPDEQNLVFAPEWIGDIERMTDRFAEDGRVALVGLCAGSWSAARLAAARPIPLTVLMSPNYFKTRTLRAGEFSALQRAGDDNFLPRGRGLKARVRDAMPGWLWRILARTELFHDPAQLLDPAARPDGNGILVMLTPDDVDGFRSHRGFDALERLRRRGRDVRLQQYDFGDHSLHGPRIRAQVRRDLRREVAARFPGDRPAEGPADRVPQPARVGRA